MAQSNETLLKIQSVKIETDLDAITAIKMGIELEWQADKELAELQRKIESKMEADAAM